MPVGVEERRLGNCVQAGAFVGGDSQVGGGEVVGQLLLGAGADETELTAGRPSSQEIATWAADTPCASLISTSTSIVS